MHTSIVLLLGYSQWNNFYGNFFYNSRREIYFPWKLCPLRSNIHKYTQADTNHFVVNPIGLLNIAVIHQSLHVLMPQHYNAKLVHTLLYNKSGNICSSLEYTLHKFVFSSWGLRDKLFFATWRKEKYEAAEWFPSRQGIYKKFNTHSTCNSRKPSILHCTWTFQTMLVHFRQNGNKKYLEAYTHC